MSRINIAFEDAKLIGQGTINVEHGKLWANETRTIQKSDVLYLNLRWGILRFEQQEEHELEPGNYVVVSGGLFKKVLPA